MYNMYVYINIHISIYYQKQKLYRHIWWHKTFFDSKTIKNISNIKKFNKGKCQPCAFNKNTFVIRHNVTCNSSCETYLMECCICEKSHYVGKSKYSLNLRISTYINSVWRTDGLPCDIHFKCQVIISMLILSLITLNRLIISLYQSRKFAAC